jgi:hypothetical protein
MRFTSRRQEIGIKTENGDDAWHGAGRVVKLVDDFNKKMDYITNSGRTFYFYTNQNAPRYKVRRDA